MTTTERVEFFDSGEDDEDVDYDTGATIKTTATTG